MTNVPIGELIDYCRRKELQARVTACQCRRDGGDAAFWEQRAEDAKFARQMVERTGRRDELVQAEMEDGL